MLGFLWHNFLYLPLLNTLIFLYNGPAFQNLGVAIIFLTLGIRFLLLPFSIISEFKEGLYKKLAHEANLIKQAYKDDPVLQKQEIRELLRKHKVSPWAKAIVLGVQAVVLVILYQVFIGGMKFSQPTFYSWVIAPDFVNTNFLGFDLARRSILWPFLVAAFLYLEIVWEQRLRRGFLMSSDLVYRFFFPLMSFIVLAVLPMAKSVFILTSLLFSVIIVGGLRLFLNLYLFKPEEEDED